MRVLVTGHLGYIGVELVSLLRAAGHDVVGLDAGWFDECDFGGAPDPVPAVGSDVRDVSAADLEGIEAVLHLAAISNDPLGDLNPALTYAINYEASVRLARCAKQAGVRRFVFASSCSLYGTGGSALLGEEAPFRPVTPYGESKVRVEQALSALADRDFSPTSLRNATAYGVSRRLRADVVVNNLVGYAYTTGKVLLQSDGTAWRPLVHHRDIARAFLAVLEAPRELVHGQAFNVGHTSENYRIRDVAQLVAEVVPGCQVSYAEGVSTDARDYRVDFTKIARLLGWAPLMTLRGGIQELYDAYQRHGLTADEFLGPRYYRLRVVRDLLRRGILDSDLRRAAPVSADCAVVGGKRPNGADPTSTGQSRTAIGSNNCG